MKRTWTIIGVANVANSFRWYQSLFGQPETNPEHDDFGQIVDSDWVMVGKRERLQATATTIRLRAARRLQAVRNIMQCNNVE
jgi:hypothetical protein